MKTLIKNGYIINPATGFEQIADVLIDKDKVVKISTTIEDEAEKIIDATNCWVVPGLIDVHVHLREPGYEYKETIATGAKSAAKGGFTTVCAMPNTKPATDSVETVRYIINKAEKEAAINVLPVGAITRGQEGEILTDIKALKEAGICAISEDGKSVMASDVLKKAMILAKEVGLPVLSHCEDDALAKDGCMHEGEVSKRLGLPGIPGESEDIIVARDILLSKATGAQLHLCHISTKDSVSMIRHAKVEKLPVTVEVCPHHFTLTDEAVTEDNPNTKMNPPLRSKEDVESIKKAFLDDTIDIIATDHAPHHENEKNCDFEKAANGIVGLETAVSLTITELVEQGYLTPKGFVEKLSYNPAKMLGIDKGDLSVGKTADISIIDPEERHKIDVDTFVSKSNNSPFHGKEVKGRVKYTLVNGAIVYKDEK